MTELKRIEAPGSTRVSFRPSEAKDVVGVDPSTIYRWVKHDGLVMKKVGGTSLILVSDFLDFLERVGG